MSNIEKIISGTSRLSAGMALALLAACSTQPRYQKPAVDTPAAFKEAFVSAAAARQWKAAQPAEALARGQWWKVFGDAQLDALEEQAMAGNHDVQAAAARLKQARAMLRGSRSALLPSIDAGFGPTRQRASNASQGLPQDAANAPFTLWRTQLGISYEADLFGRVSSTVDAATADAQRSAALYRSVLLALQADVAQNYYRIRELDAEQALYRDTVGLREHALQLMQRRFADGDISRLDVVRAESELASTQSDSLGIARRRAAAEHALAILLGKTPAEFSMAAQPLQRVPVDIPAGLPSSLLERRPDIAAAERAMAAANARVGAARAAFFPRLDLTGALGYESAQLSDLFLWSSRTFLVGPLVGTMLSLPIFDGGRRQAGLDRARAQYEEDVADYRQKVLVAFREVEDSLANLRILGQQTRVQDRALQASAHAARLLHVQYREGSINYLDVIDGDRVLLQQRRTAVQLDGERAAAAVSLIRALGGGWGSGSSDAPVAGPGPVASAAPAAGPGPAASAASAASSGSVASSAPAR